MPGPIDATLKHLTELSPQDWVVRGGWTAAPATAIDADIATIAGATDKVIRVDGPPAWLLAVDFQAGHDTAVKLPDLLLYNSALYRRHRLPVRSLLVVLHRGADSPQLTGLYERGFAEEPSDVTLRYRIVRVWQVPAEQWLSGGLGLVPLAPTASNAGLCRGAMAFRRLGAGTAGAAWGRTSGAAACRHCPGAAAAAAWRAAARGGGFVVGDVHSDGAAL
jgi:hypothetical protein